MKTTGGSLGASGVRDGWRAVLEPLASPTGRRLALLVLAMAAGQIAFGAYEQAGLGLSFLRESPAEFAAYQIGQSSYILAAVALALTIGIRARAEDGRLETEAMSPSSILVGLVTLAAGIAATGFFLLHPQAFHVAAQEDRPLEWASAAMLAGAGAWIGARALRRRGVPVVALCGALIGAALLLIAMEEISWGQRLFGFATPDALAERNWQSEFNLHNLQTDLSETLYYAGALSFLVLFALARDLLPGATARHKLAAWIPARGAALAAAPAVWMNYGHWNIYAVQLVTVAAVAAYPAWAVAGWRRGRSREAAAFLLAAVVAMTGQAVFLAFGHIMVELPDSTEYKEFFIALAFAVYAWGAGRADVSAAADD